MLKFFVLNIIGCIFYGLGIHVFTAPQQIAPGGASGIGILINYVANFPIGLFSFLFNIPLLVMAYKHVTKVFFRNAVFSIIVFSFVTDYVVVYFPIYKGDQFLAALFGGVFLGIGMALVHLVGSTTGGLSILGVVLQKKFPQFKVSSLLFGLNFAVVIVSGFIFNNIESVLYAVVCIYVSSYCMDHIIDHFHNHKLLMIISDHNQTIRNKIMTMTQKGITVVEGVGGYSANNKQVVFCAVAQSECTELSQTIRTIDQDAFIVVTDTREVMGGAFKTLI